MLYPADLEDYLRNSGLSIMDLQIDRSIIYILDGELRIVFCNWAWDRFAFQNGGLGLTHLSVLGTSVLDVTPDSLQPFYRTAYASARESGQAWQHDFECSSPDRFRLFHMRVLPIGGSYLCVENSLRIEKIHGSERAENQPALYVDENRRVVICSHCRRTRQAHSIGSPRWDWVPEFLTAPPGDVRPDLCDMCLRFFYPESGDSVSGR